MQSRRGIPRYYAVWRTLWSRITSGYYPAGSLLGTEMTLAAELGVSRMTLREALARLEEEGLVVRRRSFGTFVAPDVVARGVVEFTGYLEDVFLQAESSLTDYMARATIVAPSRIAEHLQLATGSQVERIRRRRSNARQPRIWLIDYVRLDVSRQFTDEEIRSGSVLKLIDESDDGPLSYGHQTIRATIGSAEVCRRLEVAAGSPVLSAERAVHSRAGTPLVFTEMYYPGQDFSFEIRLGRI
jgi:GntR family transcriptional regulator